jgi:4-amino-4-deoxy-L-arabinose transferase-like glycosyltransferase
VTPLAVPVAEPRFWLTGLLLVGAALLPRMLLFPFEENLYGDAVIRTELAQRWAAAPHWIASYADGAYQFGPLQIYLMGFLLKLGVGAPNAGRYVSVLFGALTVLPLHALTRRFFGWRAGVVAALGLGAWGMHIQMSTTAGSEALCTFLVLMTLALIARGMDEGLLWPLGGAALFLNLACATRYDAWALVPLLGAALWLSEEDKIAAFTRAMFFMLLCLPFPLAWMQGNELAKGSAFYPFQTIEQFHREWFPKEAAYWGSGFYRLQNLFFWPGVALVTLSPLVALWGFHGMARAWRQRPETRWLLGLALVPAGYFTLRATVMGTFAPLARFAVNQVVLVLPFVAYGFEALWSHRSRSVRLGAAGLTALVALGLPIGIGVRTAWREDSKATTLRPVSPISTNPPSVTRVARFLRDKVRPTMDAVALDTSPYYWDLQIAFFSELPEEQLARRRWDTFEQRMREGRVRYVVLADGGELAKEVDVPVGQRELTFRGRRYAELPGFGDGFRVFALSSLN